MTSYAKFDTWQNTAGVPYQNILQVQFLAKDKYRITTNSTAMKFMELGITTTVPYSRIYIDVTLVHSSNNADIDGGAAVGYKIGAPDPSLMGYTTVHGFNFSRHYVGSGWTEGSTGSSDLLNQSNTNPNLGNFWAQDTMDPGGGTYSGQYFQMARNYQCVLSPKVDAGTTLYFGVFVSSGSSFNWGSSTAGGVGDGGQTSTLKLMEISS